VGAGQDEEQRGRLGLVIGGFAAVALQDGLEGGRRAEDGERHRIHPAELGDAGRRIASDCENFGHAIGFLFARRAAVFSKDSEQRAAEFWSGSAWGFGSESAAGPIGEAAWLRGALRGKETGPHLLGAFGSSESGPAPSRTPASRDNSA